MVWLGVGDGNFDLARAVFAGGKYSGIMDYAVQVRLMLVIQGSLFLFQKAGALFPWQEKASRGLQLACSLVRLSHCRVTLTA